MSWHTLKREPVSCAAQLTDSRLTDCHQFCELIQINVPAADDNTHFFVLNGQNMLQRRRCGEAPGWLNDHFHPLRKEAHCLDKLCIGDGDDFVDVQLNDREIVIPEISCLST